MYLPTHETTCLLPTYYTPTDNHVGANVILNGRDCESMFGCSKFRQWMLVHLLVCDAKLVV